MTLLLIFVLGLCIGSFIGAYSYRYPRNISIAKGRSFCPHCKHSIEWRDNIPLLSFLVLRGKCRHCGKKISIREPILELSAGIGFVFIYLYSLNFSLLSMPLNVTLVFLLVMFAISLAIVVIDFENKIIPDELVFSAFILSFFVLLLSPATDVWVRMLVAFCSAAFLLVLNLVTKGRGMGLGDVKLALFPGLILGFPQALAWMFVSFVLGAAFGCVLIILKKAKMRTKMAFGPFLLIGFWITLLQGETVVSLILPYILM